MKPIDYRNETFLDIQHRLSGMREEVHRAWVAHGPCTTEELAERSGISILTLRPRTTELYEMGFVALVEERGASPRTRRGGVYRAADVGEAAEIFHARRREHVSGQGELAL